MPDRDKYSSLFLNIRKLRTYKVLYRRAQVHVGLLNDAVLELKGLIHGLLRRDERGLNNNSLDDVTDSDRSGSDDDRLNLVKMTNLVCLSVRMFYLFSLFMPSQERGALCLPACLCLLICFSICLSVCLFVCLSVCE
jgi:hypothetical protein